MKNKKLTTSKKKEGIFEIIKTEKLNSIKPLRISKLRNLFKIKQNDNYFIINSCLLPKMVKLYTWDYSRNNTFSIWDYNSSSNQIEKKIKENEIVDNSQIVSYEEFNSTKIDKYIEFKLDESFIKNNNNYFVYKKKYLLLCSGHKKSDSPSGIYIIDLEYLFIDLTNVNQWIV